jgi:hypothetical protein
MSNVAQAEQLFELVGATESSLNCIRVVYGTIEPN